ncbi:MAG: hypothetical protein ABH951_01240 [Patescibacteria group bacterium]
MPEEKEKEQIKKIKVETFADDMAKAIESGQGSVIKQIIKEQERKEDLKEGLSVEDKKNTTYIILGVLMVIFAFVIFVVILAFKDKVFTSTIEPKFTPIIFLDKTNIIDASGMTKENLANAVFGKINTVEIAVGDVEGIYLTNNKKPVGFREFAGFIRSNMTADKEKIAFLSDNFLIGINSNAGSNLTEPSKNLFFLLQMRSISDIFLVMKEWENKMFLDLHGFFGLSINTDTNYLLTKDFEDGIVQNKNARILRDNEGNIVLMYVYVTNTSVLITNSEDTSREIITRLAASQVRK